MNGRPLTPDHGAPLRLIVPGWYGMASVKWLARITALTEPFRGFFQADRYVIEGRPIGPIAPRALITSPIDGESVAKDGATIRGYAWSGHGPVQLVEVSVDGGVTWTAATLTSAVAPTAWREWHLEWRPAADGRAVVVARATDAAGDRQPLAQVWNELGYRNSAAQPVVVEVV